MAVAPRVASERPTSEDMSEDMQTKVSRDRATRGARRDPALMTGKNAALIPGRARGRPQSTNPRGAPRTEKKRDAVGSNAIGPVDSIRSKRE